MSSEGDPAPEQDYLDAFVGAFKWKDLPRLARLLHDKQFKGKRGMVTWGERPAAAENTKTREMLTTADRLLDTIAGGDTETFMSELIRRDKHVVVVNGLRAEGDDASVKLELLLARLRAIAERLESTSTPELHTARLDILRSLKGVRGFKLLTAAGWRISKEVWAKLGESIIVKGNRYGISIVAESPDGSATGGTELVSKGGRPPISTAAQDALRTLIQSDDHSTVVSQRYVTHGATADAPLVGRALTSTVAHLHRELDKQGIQMDPQTVRRYIGTKKPANSATTVNLMPERRAMRTETDMCEKCVQGKAIFLRLSSRALPPGLAIITELAEYAESHLQPDWTREQRASVDEFVRDYCAHTHEGVQAVNDNLRDLHAIKQHRFIKTTINAYMKDSIAGLGPSEILRIRDFRENFVRGRGPKEVSSTIHRLKQTSCQDRKSVV